MQSVLDASSPPASRSMSLKRNAVKRAKVSPSALHWKSTPRRTRRRDGAIKLIGVAKQLWSSKKLSACLRARTLKLMVSATLAIASRAATTRWNASSWSSPRPRAKYLTSWSTSSLYLGTLWTGIMRKDCRSSPLHRASDRCLVANLANFLFASVNPRSLARALP